MKNLDILKKNSIKGVINRLESAITCAINKNEEVTTVCAFVDLILSKKIESQIKQAGYCYEAIRFLDSVKYIIYLKGNKSIMPNHVAESIGTFLGYKKQKIYNYLEGDIVYFKIIFDKEEKSHKVIDVEEICPTNIIEKTKDILVYKNNENDNASDYIKLSHGEFTMIKFAPNIEARAKV